MERQIMANHENSSELTDLLIQLETHGVKHVGQIKRTDDFRRLANSGLNRCLDSINYNYGIVVSTLPNVSFQAKKLSHDAEVSRCYDCYRKGSNVLDGQEYYNFTQSLSSKLTLPKGWKFIPPRFMGFAIDDSWPGLSQSYYPSISGGRSLGNYESLSLATADPNGGEVKKTVCGGVLGKGSHFVRKWIHLGDGKILFPIYEPAVVGRMYREGKIETKREFIDPEGKQKRIQDGSTNVNCLEIIAIYPDKKVLDSVFDTSLLVDGGLVSPFLTYHPNYQFQWSTTAERHAALEEIKLQQWKRRIK